MTTITMKTIIMTLHCCLHAGHSCKDSNTEQMYTFTTTPYHNRFTDLFRDHSREPVPEENFWTS